MICLVFILNKKIYKKDHRATAKEMLMLMLMLMLMQSIIEYVKNEENNMKSQSARVDTPW